MSTLVFTQNCANVNGGKLVDIAKELPDEGFISVTCRDQETGNVIVQFNVIEGTIDTAIQSKAAAKLALKGWS